MLINTQTILGYVERKILFRLYVVGGQYNLCRVDVEYAYKSVINIDGIQFWSYLTASMSLLLPVSTIDKSKANKRRVRNSG